MPTDRLTITLDSEVLARVYARGTNRSRIISEDLARLYRLADLYHQMPAAIRLLLDGMGLAPQPRKASRRKSPAPPQLDERGADCAV